MKRKDSLNFQYKPKKSKKIKKDHVNFVFKMSELIKNTLLEL